MAIPPQIHIPVPPEEMPSRWCARYKPRKDWFSFCFPFIVYLYIAANLLTVGLLSMFCYNVNVEIQQLRQDVLQCYSTFGSHQQTGGFNYTIQNTPSIPMWTAEPDTMYPWQSSNSDEEEDVRYETNIEAWRRNLFNKLNDTSAEFLRNIRVKRKKDNDSTSADQSTTIASQSTTTEASTSRRYLPHLKRRRHDYSAREYYSAPLEPLPMADMSSNTMSSTDNSLIRKTETTAFEADNHNKHARAQERNYRHRHRHGHRHRHRHHVPSDEMMDRENQYNKNQLPLESGKLIRPALHLHGNTSRYVLGQHDNFNGNGHLRHPQRIFQDWAESEWFRALDMHHYFEVNNGRVHIKEAGLYFVYAQIYYLDEHDTNGYRIRKNEQPILQCTTTIHSEKKMLKGHTCFTAGSMFLAPGDVVMLEDLSAGRYSIFEPAKSFFGLIQLGTHGGVF